MFKILSMLYGLLYEIFFDDKEEYDIKSHKFKLTRVLGVIVFSLSIVTNFWLYKEYYRLARNRGAEPAKTQPTPAPKVEDPPRPKLDLEGIYEDDPGYGDHDYQDPEERTLGRDNRFKSIDEILEEERRKRNTRE